MLAARTLMRSSASPRRDERVGSGTPSLRTRFFSMPPVVEVYCQALMVLGSAGVAIVLDFDFVPRSSCPFVEVSINFFQGTYPSLACVRESLHSRKWAGCAAQ
jgi:hypothetical protein